MRRALLRTEEEEDEDESDEQDIRDLTSGNGPGSTSQCPSSHERSVSRECRVAIAFGWLIRTVKQQNSPGRGWPWHEELLRSMCGCLCFAWGRCFSHFARVASWAPVSKIRDAVGNCFQQKIGPLSASFRGPPVITSPIRNRSVHTYRICLSAFSRSPTSVRLMVTMMAATTI